MKNLIFFSLLFITGLLFCFDVRKYIDKVVFVNTWQGLGSGVVIEDYFVLTCFHLDHEFFVDGLPAKVVKVHPMLDLVYLKTTQKFPEKTQLAKVITVGERVFIVGYANGVKHFLEGRISRIDENIIWVDSKVIKGLSGGGVFNELGELIGIVSGGYGYPDMLLVAINFLAIKKFLNKEEEKDNDYLVDSES